VKHLTTIAVAGLLAATALPAIAADITGAGSTFVYPVLAKWADVYRKDMASDLNYQSIGSGGGIKQITAKTVTFGATDMPLKRKTWRRTASFSSRSSTAPSVPLLNLPGIKPGEVTLTARPSPRSSSAKSPSGMIRRLPSSIRASSCRYRDCRRASLGRFGHHLHLDQLSLQGQPRMER